MKRFKSACQVQRFLSIHDQIVNLFYLRQNHRPIAEFRAASAHSFAAWAETAGAKFWLRDHPVSTFSGYLRAFESSHLIS
jgi:putative transposase